MTAETDALNLLDDVLHRARATGADSADAVWVQGTSVSVTRRLGKTEELSRSEGRDLGLRVFVGNSQAMVSSSDTAPAALAELVERAVKMAKAGPADDYAGLAEPSEIASAPPVLELYDQTEFSAEELIERAQAAEDAARGVAGITNSEGASASMGKVVTALAATNGFRGAYRGSRFGIGVSVLAGQGTEMVRDYEFTAKRFAEDLDDPATVGRIAGERTVRRLSPRRVKTARVPVVFDRRVSKTILGALAGAINGASVARGTSFLKDRMGEQVLASGITIIDDPFRARGLASHPYDGEGIAGERRAVIDDGRLTTWFLDCRSARQLGLKSTGHAARGTGSPPSPAPSNLYMEPGAVSRAQMIADIGTGLYVEELIGHGVNLVTGDFSQGAAGYWIENGEITYPVSEITIAGNLKDIFMNLTPANDLQFRYGTDAPTLRIDGLTVAGT